MKVIKTLLILIIIIIGVNFLSNKSDAVFKFIGYRTYTVLSGSMEQEFYPGDLIVTKHKDKTDIEVNDIVTFQMNGEVITHRIIGKVDGGYQTKGDNNNIEDPYVISEGEIIGEAKLVVPRIGFIVIFLANPIVLSIEAILLGIYILYLIKTEEEKSRNKKMDFWNS